LPRQLEAVSRPPEATPQVQHHLKIIDHKKLANATLDYNISTDEISRGFAQKYALREGDRYALRKDLRKMRLAQKVLLVKIRAKFPINCNTEDRRQEYLNYFEQESLRAVSCQSDRTTTSTSGEPSDHADYVYNTGSVFNIDATICG